MNPISLVIAITVMAAPNAECEAHGTRPEPIAIRVAWEPQMKASGPLVSCAAHKFSKRSEGHGHGTDVVDPALMTKSGLACYRILISAARMTMLHFSASAARRLANAAGEPVSAAPPRSAILAFNLGSPRAALISRFSLSTTSFGVFFGAAMPNTAPASKPGRKSPTVGRSGSACQRFALATANARNLPARMCSIDDGQEIKHDLHLPGDQVGNSRSTAAIRHVNHVNAGHHFE